jgi:hypothetical protein
LWLKSRDKSDLFIIRALSKKKMMLKNIKRNPFLEQDFSIRTYKDISGKTVQSPAVKNVYGFGDG